MPPARKEMLDSVLSYSSSGENRLTELFATTLISCPKFAAALFIDVGLVPGDRFDVRTQERVAPGCVPDMVVRSLRAPAGGGPGGALDSVLWSEHKTVSGFRHEQQADYVKALGAEPCPGQLLTLTVEAEDEHAGEWERRTWQHIGELADVVGVGWGGPRWRDDALLPDAPASARILHEFVWYLEKEDFAVVRAATAEDVHVFRRFADTVDVVHELLDRAGNLMGERTEKDVCANDYWDRFWLVVAPPEGAWLSRATPFESYAEVCVAAEGGWTPEGAGAPVVGAGYTMSSELHAPLSSDSGWVERLEARGYCLEVWEGLLRCWRTRPLSEFIEAGATLTEQARELARWAREAIDELSALDPGVLDLPEMRKPRGRRGGAVADELDLDLSASPALSVEAAEGEDESPA